MLNTKNLSTLLSCNVHPELYSRLFIMSETGMLVAYSTPANIKAVRDQAALISMVWDEHTNGPLAQPDRTIQALTMEAGTHNIIARPLYRDLLLVIVGLSGSEELLPEPRITTELDGDQTDVAENESLYENAYNRIRANGSTKLPTILQLQRRKLDTVINFITSELPS